MLPPLDRIALAGTCVTCENYDPDACAYTDACLGCSRYYGDQYSERVPKSAKSVHIPATRTENSENVT